MKQFQISSFDAVYDFLFKLYDKTDREFDPADDVKNLKDKTGATLFTAAEIKYLNEVMVECFIFCVMNDLNIYTLVTMVKYDVCQVKAAA